MSKPTTTRQARHASRVRAERLALGLCIQCGKLPAAYRCATCRAKATAATAKRRRLAAAQNSLPS